MRQFLFALFVPLLLALGGCASSTDAMRPVPIIGGHMLGIPFGPHGPLPGKANGYEVLLVDTAPGPKDRQIIYRIALSLPPGVKLLRVQVDDISEEQHGLLVDDQHPWQTDDRWHIETAPMNADDPQLAWIYTVIPSMRVYRFTITDSTGRETILYQASGYPDFIKAAIRRTWGEKY